MDRQLMQAVATLVAVERIWRTEGHLDEVCRARMQEAQRTVAEQGGVAVAAAFVQWLNSGQIAPDPRRRPIGGVV